MSSGFIHGIALRDDGKWALRMVVNGKVKKGLFASRKDAERTRDALRTSGTWENLGVEPPVGAARQAVVYFVRQVPDGPVKIGTATYIKQRLMQLRGASPTPLELMGVIVGGWQTEQLLHEKFAALRMHGEWFRPDPSLLSYIRASIDRGRTRPRAVN